MRERSVTIPELALIAGTRVALGIGIGLLLSGRMDRHTRKGAGWALLAIGAATTGPLIATIARRSRRQDEIPPAVAA